MEKKPPLVPLPNMLCSQKLSSHGHATAHCRSYHQKRRQQGHPQADLDLHLLIVGPQHSRRDASREWDIGVGVPHRCGGRC